MSGMDEFLAAHYGTAGGAQTTETEKAAAAEQEAAFEMFAKVAAAEGIDLTSMTDEQVMELYTKVASEDDESGEAPKGDEKKDEKDEKEKKEKEAAAKAELAAKTAAATATPEQDAQEKIAEADFLGRVMAHAYVQEMKKIAAAGDQTVEEKTEEQKIASMKDNFLKNLHKGKDLASSAASKIKDKAGKHLENVGKKVTEKATGTGTSNMKPGHAKAVGGAAYGAAGAAAGGAAAALHHGKEKKSSALDELAAESAMKKIAAAGFDVDQGAQLLSELLTKGASEEGTKIAAANGDLDGAVEIRSLELLDQAGYPVTWAQ